MTPRPLLLPLAVLALLAACGGGKDGAAPTEQSVALSAPSAPTAAASAPEMRELRGSVTGRAVAADYAAAAPPPPPAVAPAPGAALPASSAQPDAAATSMVIRTGQAAVEVDSLEPALAAVRALAARLGGHVGNATMAAGRDQVRSATLQVRVPSDRFDALVGGLSPLGRVETVNVQAEDVGEEFVDVSARAANARRLEARLVALLERGTPRLSDVLQVERELARVREEIERMEGRLRFLRARAAMSTLEITAHEPPPLVGPSGSGHPLAHAARQAWRNFLALLAFGIASLGVLVPVAAVAAVAWRVGRRLRAPAPVSSAP
jgi:hypothetical protein